MPEAYKPNPAGQRVNKMMDNSKFWIADIFYRNPMFFSSREEFEEEFNNLREIGVQFTWNDPEM